MKALILVDLQKDFLPGGSLAVEAGDQVVPVVNKILDDFKLVVATQDWHPANHGSFASNHEGKKPGDVIELEGLEQILWPDHCVQQTEGAEFSFDLNTNKISQVFKKGMDPKIDSYSGFYDNGHKKGTGLDAYLKEKGVDTVYIAGLAADVCVRFTALDALQLGYNTKVIKDATLAVEGEKGYQNTLEELEKKGAELVESEKIHAHAG